ncbi:GNAT family N-acetyltransferase [Pseudoroseomonas globiformis]|uniref:GNAT family N-acetyltransferase n=1 Tax=Teichococcus globiformis TaxID=2307229 RepID=A0ABV7G4H0_9PROT
MTQAEGLLPFRFRPATEADFEPLLDLSVRTLRTDLERLGRFDQARRRANLRKAFETGALRMIECSGVPTGCIGVQQQPHQLYVFSFYIEPSRQGAGLGAAVMRTVLAEAPGLPVRLEVLRDSRAARFYERLGFNRTGEDGVDWLYEKPLWE